MDERNQLLERDGNDVQTVRMSAEIRGQIKEIGKMTENLEAKNEQERQKIEKDKAKVRFEETFVDPKGKPVVEGAEEKIKDREEIIELCHKHIQQCREMEREGYSGGNNKDTFVLSTFSSDTKTIAELPDIDGDEGFQLLRRQDALIVL